MPADTLIRQYRPDDAPRLLDIWTTASRIAHPFFTDDQRAEQRRLIETIYLPQAENWVACLEDRPAGFIGLMDHHVGGLFVDPAWQGSGVGRALIDHAHGLKGQLTLEVYALNTGACGFYRHLGFRETARRPVDDNGLPFELIALARP
jgi:putative acetyltransferase